MWSTLDSERALYAILGGTLMRMCGRTWVSALLLFVVSITGVTSEHQTASDEAAPKKSHKDFAPDISPNGEFITYYSYRVDPKPDLYVYTISTQTETRLSQTPDIWEIEPKWIDDTHIAFSAGESMQGLEVHVMNVETGGRAKFHPDLTDDHGLTFGPSNPIDQRGLVSIARSENQDDQMVIIDQGGTVEKLAAKLPPGKNASPHASPDGTHIVFQNQHDGRTDLYVLDRLSGEHWPITDNLTEENYLNWSRDGRWILYRPQDEASPPHIHGIEVDLQSRSLGQPRQLTNGDQSQVHFYSAISVDGQWLYYDANSGSDFYIFRQSLYDLTLPPQQITGRSGY